jgi:hypothetical protein
MNQNSFCTKCHRIPNQCVCGGTFRELTDEEIKDEWFDINKSALSRIEIDMQLIFARAILRKASEK